jgi:hypothetical protein
LNDEKIKRRALNNFLMIIKNEEIIAHDAFGLKYFTTIEITSGSL